MKNSDKKAKFRKSKEWKEFRKKIYEKQKGCDYLSGKKLYKGHNIHHLDMSIENYDKLDEDNFIALNKQMHDVVHILFRYYKNDKTILSRLEQILEKMDELNR